MKTIVRIEFPEDGFGMFKTFLGNGLKRNIRPLDEFCKTVHRRHGDFNDPFRDGLDLNRGIRTWFCSYKSIEQLQQWIQTEELKTIIKEGYRIYVLDVNEYQEGRDQIIYTKESINSSKDITSLFI